MKKSVKIGLTKKQFHDMAWEMSNEYRDAKVGDKIELKVVDTHGNLDGILRIKIVEKSFKD